METSGDTEEDDRLSYEVPYANRRLTPEASFQTCLDGISDQIQSLKNELKTDLKTFKDEITTQMRNELTELKEDIDPKFMKMTTEIGEQNEKIATVLRCTEEVEL